MNGRRTIVGLCMLSALLVSAFAAQSASAITGTTAFTCVNGQGGKELRGEHCLKEGTAQLGFGHVGFNQNETTNITGTNAQTFNNTTEPTTSILKVTIAGVPLELAATGVSGSGHMENKVAASGEHLIHGTGTITFTGVTVKAPAGRGCKVFTDVEATKTKGEEGVVHTRELTATTEGQGDFLKFTPLEGTSFANFFVECEEGKKIPGIEGTWECTGSVKGVPNGATTVFGHEETTAQNTLKCRGAKAGIAGDLTLRGKKPIETEYKPLSTTTVVT